MNSSNIEPRPLAQNLRFSDSELIVTLLDGRIIHILIAWYPSLANATEKQRANWELLGEGDGIHWLDLDEDLSVEESVRAAVQQAREQQWLEENREAIAEYNRRVTEEGILSDWYGVHNDDDSI